MSNIRISKEDFFKRWSYDPTRDAGIQVTVPHEEDSGSTTVTIYYGGRVEVPANAPDSVKRLCKEKYVHEG